MIRQTIIAAMRHHELRPAELSRMAGLPPSSVSRYLHRRRDLSGNRAGRLLHALGISVGGRSALELRDTVRAAVVQRDESLRQQAKICKVNARVFAHYLEGRRDSGTEIVDKMLRGLGLAVGGGRR